ncbi:hypothetical protein FGW37_17600 [Streptomyces rectiverticillatus]|uniref:hypothetical protein n=1 Tax=Streptomyces rectiverticillatus TaxID=173860 RepID=UPI0015C31283|nr:hypothetical protein [Streptomyces rectiverticillatus]QLE73159.1 hypothetical protein FGW37_17600 [Streptomyces rectiverticillatus]
MHDLDQCHASLRKGATATRDGHTGEIRVPLALFFLDRQQGPLELVLSSVEAAEFHVLIGKLLAGGTAADGSLLSARVADANRRSSGGGL